MSPTTPLRSWTLCNRATARQRRGGREMDGWIGCCKAAMSLLNNTMTRESAATQAQRTQTHHYAIVPPKGRGEIRLSINRCSTGRGPCYKI